MEFDDLERELRKCSAQTLSEDRKRAVWFKITKELDAMNHSWGARRLINALHWLAGVGLVASAVFIVWVAMKPVTPMTPIQITGADRSYSVPLTGVFYSHLKKSGFLINIPSLPFKPKKITSYEYPLGKGKAFLAWISSKSTGNFGDFIEFDANTAGYNQWLTPKTLKSENGTLIQAVWLKHHVRAVYYKLGGLQGIEWVSAGVYGQIKTGSGMYSYASQDLLHKTKPYLTKAQIVTLANKTLKTRQLK